MSYLWLGYLARIASLIFALAWPVTLYFDLYPYHQKNAVLLVAILLFVVGEMLIYVEKQDC